MSITPFDDHGESTDVAGLTIENGQNRIAIYGRLGISRDRQGLADAHALKNWVDAIVAALESMPDLPARTADGETSHPVENPF
ncbi:hypothetical protein HLH33_13745 [Gluconacetobacter diazotrophicus]|uniref:Uncharacterized protein n=1 Tax=Gluconacetobacter diazotrophicus TaxID=33996 RepID=A0A7W4NGJ4_GLUDI|nr:hypothetical protein [Gluconacetobacter diazotrophicus]MBB2157362.1 hypothetical protein [Gluconacetobacter diazotrophicus]